MWEALSNDHPSPRTEVLLNIDPFIGFGAIRIGKHKLVFTRKMRFGSDQRLRTAGNPRPSEDLEQLTEHSLAASVLQRFYGANVFKTRQHWRNESTVDCCVGNCVADNFASGTQLNLFDVEVDPCELNNLASVEKGVSFKYD